MQWVTHAVTAAAVLCIISSGLAQRTRQQPQEPLCVNKNCPRGEDCRLVETCDSAFCSWSAVCVPENESQYIGGCRIGKPLLFRNRTGRLELRTCYTSRNCAPGFYCSTDLQDVASRCCRANHVPTNKRGSCPAPEGGESFFCVDSCRSDADCHGSLKCCQEYRSCPRRVCTLPDPCSVQQCPPGSRCVLDPDRTAHCVAAPPTTATSHPPTPPLRPSNNNNNNNNNGNNGQVPLPGSGGHQLPTVWIKQRRPTFTCPHIQSPVRWDTDCNARNQCTLNSAWGCPVGKACCPSYYCGFICRQLVPRWGAN
ncbi:uncharacterized protein LOC143297837 [Babylonia areolata]|uniref:uncharacterized protein LOC143297837 n=1 Tax=Babylonia areolata TaxID=304850 RepID=UPI003FD16AFD